MFFLIIRNVFDIDCDYHFFSHLRMTDCILSYSIQKQYFHFISSKRAINLIKLHSTLAFKIPSLLADGSVWWCDALKFEIEKKTRKTCSIHTCIIGRDLILLEFTLQSLKERPNGVIVILLCFYVFLVLFSVQELRDAIDAAKVTYLDIQIYENTTMMSL